MGDIPPLRKKEVLTAPVLSLLTVYCNFTPDGDPPKGGEGKKDDPPKKEQPKEDTSGLVPKKKKPVQPPDGGKEDPLKGLDKLIPPEVAKGALVDKPDAAQQGKGDKAPPIVVVKSGKGIADMEQIKTDEKGGISIWWVGAPLAALGGTAVTDFLVTKLSLGLIEKNWTGRLIGRGAVGSYRIVRDTLDFYTRGYLGLKDPVLTYKLPAEADLIHSSMRGSRAVDPRAVDTPLAGTETVSFKGLSMVLPDKVTARDVVKQLKRLENDTDFRKFLEDQIKEEEARGRNKDDARLKELKERREAYKKMSPELQAKARKQVIDEIFEGNESMLEAARKGEARWRGGRVVAGTLIAAIAISYVLRGLANKQSDNPPPLVEPQAKPPG